MKEEQAETAIKTIVATPSSEELSVYVSKIMEQLPSKEIQLGYICGKWTAKTSLPQETVMVFVESEVDKRGKLYKAVKTAGRIVEMKRQDTRTLTTWIRRTWNDNHMVRLL